MNWSAFILMTLLLTPFTGNAAFKRDCALECPATAANLDPHAPFYLERKRCIATCEQSNARQEELEQQTRQMQTQTELLEEQLEAQQELRTEIQEQQEKLEDIERQLELSRLQEAKTPPPAPQVQPPLKERKEQQQVRPRQGPQQQQQAKQERSPKPSTEVQKARRLQRPPHAREFQQPRISQ